MATLEQILSHTTMLCYPGGTSGQHVISTLHHCRHFAKYDKLDISTTGSVPRRPYWPFNERQFVVKLPHQAITTFGTGPIEWIPTEENRQWLRTQTWRWFMRRWRDEAIMPIDQALAEGKQLVFHSHLGNDFLQWLLPEARKLFMLTKNSYFGMRADAVKNWDKHPTEPDKLLRYLVMRTGWHVHWSREIKFDYPNSTTFQWSDFVTEDRSTFEKCLRNVVAWHGFEIEPDEMAAAWEGTCRYVAAQKKVGLLF